MKILVTGGAGFIGRWVVKKLIAEGHKVVALDNLSNSSTKNIEEFIEESNFEFVKGNILDEETLNKISDSVELCIHLAAQINVQESLDYPDRAFINNVVGTYNILEACRRQGIKLVLVGTCMIYDMTTSEPIDEKHSVKPTSPYAATKLASEELALAYNRGYGLPVVVTRPFNAYGPFQKSNMEGGVVSIFISRFLQGKNLHVYGEGTQTRDLLYVEDCAEFITRAAFNDKAVGEIINGGSGRDISINDLAFLICKNKEKIKHVSHHHPQAEIQKLVCDCSKAEKLLGWRPKVSLEEGIDITKSWIEGAE